MSAVLALIGTDELAHTVAFAALCQMTIGFDCDRSIAPLQPSRSQQWLAAKNINKWSSVELSSLVAPVDCDWQRAVLAFE